MIDDKILELVFAVERTVSVLSGYVRGVLARQNEEVMSEITIDENALLSVSMDTDNVKKEMTVDFNFTKKELTNMTEDFKKNYMQNGLVLNVRAKGNVYEIRYRRDGLSLSASSKNLAEAKKKMHALIVEAYGAKKEEVVARQRKTAIEYFLWYINEVKKPRCNERYVEHLIGYVERQIRPVFADRRFSDISFSDLQRLMNDLTGAGKNRTAKGVRTLLIEVYRSAVYDGEVRVNHAERLAPVVYDEKHGRALSPDEEKRVVEAILRSESAHKNDYLIMLFAGLRPCEVASVRYDGDFIVVKCAKKRTGTEQYRRIPITPQFRRFVDLNAPVGQVLTRQLEKSLSVLFGGDMTLYTFRHTFITRAQECGVPQEVVQAWVGHSSKSLLGRVYTHYSDDYMREMALLVDY